MRRLSFVLAALFLAACTHGGEHDARTPSRSPPALTVGAHNPDRAPQRRTEGLRLCRKGCSTLPQGLFDVSQGDYPPALFAFAPVNGWARRVRDTWVAVIAGRSLRVKDGDVRLTPRGAVLVQTLHLSTGRASYLSLYPGLRGPLRITDASGVHLLIRSTRTGQRVTFDVKSNSFT
jgi:hypothetical protein